MKAAGIAIAAVVIAGAGVFAISTRVAHKLPEDLHYARTAQPPGSVALDDSGKVVAEFTDGARTVVVRGPKREFVDSQGVDVRVTHDSWVRILPEPWKPESVNVPWLDDWFANATSWSTPDALEVAFEYVTDAPEFYDDKGVRFRGDANFGPLSGDGRTREVGGDFYDYLQVPWPFPNDGVKQPNPEEARNLDCSGYLRMVYGYRLGLPLALRNGPENAIPRLADEIGRAGPGVGLAATGDVARAKIGELRPGDLVFFDTDDDLRWNHSGIYVGVDDTGSYRFISSRGTANGPSMSDLGAPSVLDGTALYARGFAGIRRL